MERLGSWRRRVRSHPRLLDGAVAVVVLGLALSAGTAGAHRAQVVARAAREADAQLRASTVVFAVLACAALTLRGRRPRTVLAVTLSAAVADLATSDTGRSPVIMTVLVALYTVASRTDRPTAWRIAAPTAVSMTAAAMLLGPDPWLSGENLAVLAWTGLAAAAGDAVRSRRAYIAAIEERAERAERTREEEARRRVAEERMRIARELHDVVAHHIALVNVQAGVASHVMDSRPDQARQALAHVREAGRSALQELRATVGLLRQGEDSAAPTEPVPGLADLGRLVESFTRAGLPVVVTVTATGGAPARGPRCFAAVPSPERAAVSVPGGARSPAGTRSPAAAGVPDAAPTGPPLPDRLAAEAVGPLPVAVDLAAYRVVQESLTNVRKHAGPHASARVRIERAARLLEITVVDDGTATAPPAPSGGHGLVGMRERAVALGGSCEAGPLPGGGYRVRVRLPLEGEGR